MVIKRRKLISRFVINFFIYFSDCLINTIRRWKVLLAASESSEPENEAEIDYKETIILFDCLALNFDKIDEIKH